jgi:hypothetical protein
MASLSNLAEKVEKMNNERDDMFRAMIQELGGRMSPGKELASSDESEDSIASEDEESPEKGKKFSKA